jgi:hypothetical protein
MNKINQFFDKSPLWQIYIFGWFFTGAFVAALFYGLQLIDPPNSKMLITGINCIKMGALTGILFGLMIMLMVSMMRKSQIFWDYAKEIEGLIEKAETKDELGSIWKGEFQDLRKLAQGGPHLSELTRQYTIMQTKYKYVK